MTAEVKLVVEVRRSLIRFVFSESASLRYGGTRLLALTSPPATFCNANKVTSRLVATTLFRIWGFDGRNIFLLGLFGNKPQIVTAMGIYGEPSYFFPVEYGVN